MSGTRSEKLSFTGAQGDILAARLDRPAGEPRAYALFAHCFTCSKDSLAASHISTALAEKGFAVLRFDFTGLGHSDGEFANTNFSSNVADLAAAADHLRQHHAAPAVLIGHSLGGAAVLAAAGRIPEARAVVTIGAPFDPAHVSEALGAAVETIRREGEAEVDLGGRPFHIRRQFLDDIAEQNLAAAIADLDKALLVMHTPTDTVVGIDNASHIFLAAKHPKSFVSLDDADHLLGRRDDAVYAGTVIAAWAERYIPHPADLDDQTDLPHGQVLVRESGDGPFGQHIAAGRHVLTADEPEDYGGHDTGPSPYEYLLAGLGACTAMTMRMYARRKSLPLQQVSVRLDHKKIHAEDCADCETNEGMIDRIRRIITIDGPDLTAEQRAKLMEIADKCPVHRTLHSEIKIDTEVAAVTE
jgi:putative redox protein